MGVNPMKKAKPRVASTRNGSSLRRKSVVALSVAIGCALSSTTTSMNGYGVEAFGNTLPSRQPPLATPTTIQQQSGSSRLSLFNNDDQESTAPEISSSNSNTPWSPSLRKIMAGLASLGAIETGYLTYSKLVNQAAPTLFCGSSQSAATSCDTVLNGPYSNLPFFDNIPLAALGFVAYSSVVALALQPLMLSSENDDVDDTQNRILLTALSTAMGTFSIFLMTLLWGILKTTCPYCVFSAADSFMLTNLALIGGCLPEGNLLENNKRDTSGGKTVATGLAGAFLGAVLLFGSGSVDAINNPPGASSSSTLVATINGKQQPEQQVVYAPPEITTDSSKRALGLAKTLQEMDAKMYGAHWCSHCYDQKQALGKQVFAKENGFVEYVECSKDGINSRSNVCKAKEIPGYPTWEINGKLYPGEQSVEELEDLVKEIRSSNKI